MMNKKGFIKFILIMAVVLLAVVWIFSELNKQINQPIKPLACTMEAKQCPDGSYVGRTGSKCSFAECPKPTPAPIGEKIIKKVGEQEGSFQIQKINADSVDGLWYQSYPVMRDEGAPKTLHIGDDIGYACEGVSEKLTDIDFSGQIITFTRQIGKAHYGGCPICLASNTLIDTPSGSMAIKNLQIGMPIWTTNKSGQRVAEIVIKTSKVPASPTHQMVRLILDDGRELFASLGHPTTDGRIVGDLIANELYNGVSVVSAERVPYNDYATYDILPSGETGFYWANGILMASTLY